MRTNTPTTTSLPRTHGGGVAERQDNLTQLTRAVSSCLLFEKTFYESGDSIANHIQDLCVKVANTDEGLEPIVDLAIQARNDLKLRHVPLFLARQIARINSTNPRFKGEKHTETVLREIIKRPDELTEFLSLYWKDNGIVNRKDGVKAQRKTLSAQVKRGLANAFSKFDEYRLAKYNRSNPIKLKDVLFLTHAKPKDAAQDALWKRLINDELATPDTWEVSLSAGKDKKETWERLIREKKLGDMAVLMNLRNMLSANVDRELIRSRLTSWRPNSVALPFRFIAAAQHAPDFEKELGIAMMASLSQMPKLPGRTLYVVDMSGSMHGTISSKSTMSRKEVACGLAMLLREVCEDATIYATAGDDGRRIHATMKVPPRHEFALRDAIFQTSPKIGGGGIFAYQALEYIKSQESVAFDRIIVLTDEQDCDMNPKQTLGQATLSAPHRYLLNVASYKPGLEMKDNWVRINGWSEQVVKWIQFEETGKILDAENEDEQI